MASRAGLLQHPPMKAQINPGLSLSLDDKRGSRHLEMAAISVCIRGQPF
jgi:hypothetical protein